MQHLVWIVPCGILFFSFIAVGFIAPYGMIRERDARIVALESSLRPIAMLGNVKNSLRELAELGRNYANLALIKALQDSREHDAIARIWVDFTADYLSANLGTHQATKFRRGGSDAPLAGLDAFTLIQPNHGPRYLDDLAANLTESDIQAFVGTDSP